MVTESRLSILPDISKFRALTQSLAVLEIVLLDDWSSRYYSFDATWSDGTMMASMKSGHGDDWFAVIREEGVAILGLDHESPAFAAGGASDWLFPNLPSRFQEHLVHEPAFDSENSSFCIWKLPGGLWRAATHPDGLADGSDWMLADLDGDPATYRDFAEESYERDLDLEAVKAVYRHEPLDEWLIHALRDDASLERVLTEVKQTGYEIAA